MPISARCAGCGKTIMAPDGAGGRKARCPQCGAVTEIPGGPGAVAELAAAMSHASVAKGGAAAAPMPVHLPSPTPSPGAEGPLSPITAERHSDLRNGSGSSTRTSTTIDRISARTSPYSSLRLTAAIVYAVGVVLAAVVFVGGLVGLILISTGGSPLGGIGAFVGSVVASGLLFLGARMLNEVLRLGADLGDRMRQVTQLIEDLLNRP